MRNLDVGSSDQIWHKLECTFTEERYVIEISDLTRKEIVLSIMQKSCSVAMQPFCFFVFAYAKKMLTLVNNTIHLYNVHGLQCSWIPWTFWTFSLESVDNVECTVDIGWC